jgi:hypothetical protein
VVAVGESGEDVNLFGLTRRTSMRALTIVTALALTGCATVIEGTTQTVTIKTHPDDAECAVARRDELDLARTTHSGQQITVEKSRRPLVVACAKPGYKTETVVTESAVSDWGAAGIALTATGGLIDWATGAQRTYPDTVTIILKPEIVAETTKGDR